MATFVSRQVRYRVYLKDNPTGAGGLWADFGESGRYETNNQEDIDILTSNPVFGKEFFRVAEDKGIMFGCPKCDYEKPKPRAVISHASRVHKINYKKDDLIEKKVKVGV